MEEIGSCAGTLIRRIKITKLNVKPFEKNPLEVVWTPDGSQLLVSGENMLGLIQRDKWELSYSKDFGHKKPISCIAWLTDTVLATAGLDKVIKIFDYPKKKLINYITSVNEVLQISYC